MGEPEKRLVFAQDQIQQRVRELAREISRTYQDQDLVLVGVLNGVFMFFADLVKALSIPVAVDFVRLASYGTAAFSTGQIQMTKGVELDLKGRHVLIVEDIADTGLTLDYLKAHLTDQGAASVRICALIDKKERREVPVHLDFVGFEVDRGFLVGYGLDFNEQFRYLPDVYHLIFE